MTCNESKEEEQEEVGKGAGSRFEVRGKRGRRSNLFKILS